MFDLMMTSQEFSAIGRYSTAEMARKVMPGQIKRCGDCQLPKLDVAGSSPVSRSSIQEFSAAPISLVSINFQIERTSRAASANPKGQPNDTFCLHFRPYLIEVSRLILWPISFPES